MQSIMSVIINMNESELKDRGGGQTFSTSFWMRFSQAPLCRYHFKIIFDDYICF